MLACLAPARVHGAWVAGWLAHRQRSSGGAASAAALKETPFYGYAIFGLSTLISLVTYSSTIDVLGLFFASFVEDLGLSRCVASAECRTTLWRCARARCARSARGRTHAVRGHASRGRVHAARTRACVAATANP